MKASVFLMGFGVGVATGVLITKKLLDDHVEQEISEAVNFYKNKQRTCSCKVDMVKEKEPTKQDNDEYVKMLDNYRCQVQAQDLVRAKEQFENNTESALVKPAPSFVVGEVDVDEEINPGLVYDVHTNTKDEEEFCEPYLITEDEFSNENKDFDKVTLTYFTWEDVLVDEDNEVIMSVENDIWQRALSMFGSDPDNPNTEAVFVRDDKLKIDYEIVLANSDRRWWVQDDS